jgi:hypothetical protein
VSQTGSVRDHLWEDRWADGGEPGRQVVVLGVAVTLVVVAIDLLLGGELSLFFDLCFVALCLGLALAVRPGDFFTVGVLPPLLLLVTCTLLGVVAPGGGGPGPAGGGPTPGSTNWSAHIAPRWSSAPSPGPSSSSWASVS